MNIKPMDTHGSAQMAGGERASGDETPHMTLGQLEQLRHIVHRQQLVESDGRRCMGFSPQRTRHRSGLDLATGPGKGNADRHLVFSRFRIHIERHRKRFVRSQSELVVLGVSWTGPKVSPNAAPGQEAYVDAVQKQSQ